MTKDDGICSAIRPFYDRGYPVETGVQQKEQDWDFQRSTVQVIVLDARQYLRPPERLQSPERVLWTEVTAKGHACHPTRI